MASSIEKLLGYLRSQRANDENGIKFTDIHYPGGIDNYADINGEIGNIRNDYSYVDANDNPIGKNAGVPELADIIFNKKRPNQAYPYGQEGGPTKWALIKENNKKSLLDTIFRDDGFLRRFGNR